MTSAMKKDAIFHTFRARHKSCEWLPSQKY